MELVPARFHSRFLWWEGAKTFLLATGLAAAVPTLLTGEMAADAVGSAIDHAVLEKHELFAALTVWIFAILGAAYLVRTFARYGWGEMVVARVMNGKLAPIWRIKQRASSWILDTPIRPLMAIVGMITITITGALGAAMVYGPQVDPVVTFIYNLIF